mgnify:CR=1 FL=1
MSKEKILVINSLDREAGGTNADFTCFFNSDSSTQGVLKVLVKDVFIPHLFYNIEAGINDRLDFKQLNTVLQVIIPEGQYNISILKSTLKTLMDAVLTNNTVVTITEGSPTYKLNFTFSGGTLPPNDLVNFIAPDGINSTLAPLIGLTGALLQAANIPMQEIFNLSGIQYVQVHSPQIAEIHGLDSGSNSYISLLETVSMTDTGFGSTAHRQNNDDELSEILYEQPRNLSRVSIVLRDQTGRKLTLPDNHNCSVLLKIYFD